MPTVFYAKRAVVHCTLETAVHRISVAEVIINLDCTMRSHRIGLRVVNSTITAAKMATQNFLHCLLSKWS